MSHFTTIKSGNLNSITQKHRLELQEEWFEHRQCLVCGVQLDDESLGTFYSEFSGDTFGKDNQKPKQDLCQKHKDHKIEEKKEPEKKEENPKSKISSPKSKMPSPRSRTLESVREEEEHEEENENFRDTEPQKEEEKLESLQHVDEKNNQNDNYREISDTVYSSSISGSTLAFSIMSVKEINHRALGIRSTTSTGLESMFGADKSLGYTIETPQSIKTSPTNQLITEPHSSKSARQLNLSSLSLKKPTALNIIVCARPNKNKSELTRGEALSILKKNDKIKTLDRSQDRLSSTHPQNSMSYGNTSITQFSPGGHSVPSGRKTNDPTSKNQSNTGPTRDDRAVDAPSYYTPYDETEEIVKIFLSNVSGVPSYYTPPYNETEESEGTVETPRINVSPEYLQLLQDGPLSIDSSSFIPDPYVLPQNKTIDKSTISSNKLQSISASGSNVLSQNKTINKSTISSNKFQERSPQATSKRSNGSSPVRNRSGLQSDVIGSSPSIKGSISKSITGTHSIEMLSTPGNSQELLDRNKSITTVGRSKGPSSQSRSSQELQDGKKSASTIHQGKGMLTASGSQEELQDVKKSASTIHQSKGTLSVHGIQNELQDRKKSTTTARRSIDQSSAQGSNAELQNNSLQISTSKLTPEALDNVDQSQSSVRSKDQSFGQGSIAELQNNSLQISTSKLSPEALDNVDQSQSSVRSKEQSSAPGSENKSSNIFQKIALVETIAVQTEDQASHLENSKYQNDFLQTAPSVMSAKPESPLILDNGFVAGTSYKN